MMKAIIKEGLEYKDCVGMIKPTVYVDEFQSKVGEDDAYVVLSFYVRGVTVAEDLVQWFEGGYEFVVDADVSPGEIKPNRYLVFVEVKRRTQLVAQIGALIEDLETLTEFTTEDWTIMYDKNEYSYDSDVLTNALILSPQAYREIHETELNEMRLAANLPTKQIYTDNKRDAELNLFRQRAGLI
jgi:hypothetical protein